MSSNIEFKRGKAFVGYIKDDVGQNLDVKRAREQTRIAFSMLQYIPPDVPVYERKRVFQQSFSTLFPWNLSTESYASATYRYFENIGQNRGKLPDWNVAVLYGGFFATTFRSQDATDLDYAFRALDNEAELAKQSSKDLIQGRIRVLNRRRIATPAGREDGALFDAHMSRRGFFWQEDRKSYRHYDDMTSLQQRAILEQYANFSSFTELQQEVASIELKDISKDRAGVTFEDKVKQAQNFGVMFRSHLENMAERDQAGILNQKASELQHDKNIRQNNTFLSRGDVEKLVRSMEVESMALFTYGMSTGNYALALTGLEVQADLSNHNAREFFRERVPLFNRVRNGATTTGASQSSLDSAMRQYGFSWDEKEGTYKEGTAARV